MLYTIEPPISAPCPSAPARRRKGSLLVAFAKSRMRKSRTYGSVRAKAEMAALLDHTRGNYIAVLPDDDLMLPENLAKKVEVLRGNDSACSCRAPSGPKEEKTLFGVVEFNLNEYQAVKKALE